MQVFGRLFGEQVGIRSPEALPSPESLLAVVKSRLPRGTVVEDEVPTLEAAAYIGEWLRQRAEATWIAEGAFEPHLQLVDRTHAIVYLLPLVQLLRTASTAGYDGMSGMLREVLDDVNRDARRVELAELRVTPQEERGMVIEWIRDNRAIRLATRAALWRRCSICAEFEETAVTIPGVGSDWEGEAAGAAQELAAVPFECPCGGPPGATTRFLMMRNRPDGATHFGDIYVSSTHTRVGCWAIEGEMARPVDALALAHDELPSLDEG